MNPSVTVIRMTDCEPDISVLDICDLAYYFKIEEYALREFCARYKKEIRLMMRCCAIDFIEEFGMLDGLIPNTDLDKV